MALHSELWFPSVIWSGMVHVVDNHEFKKWAYTRKTEDVGRVISNFSGYQSSDILPRQSPLIDNLVSHINKEIDNFDFIRLTKTKYKISAVEYVNTFFFDKAEDKNYLNEMNQIAKDFDVKNLLILLTKSKFFSYVFITVLMPR